MGTTSSSSSSQKDGALPKPNSAGSLSTNASPVINNGGGSTSMARASSFLTSPGRAVVRRASTAMSTHDRTSSIAGAIQNEAGYRGSSGGSNLGIKSMAASLQSHGSFLIRSQYYHTQQQQQQHHASVRRSTRLAIGSFFTTKDGGGGGNGGGGEDEDYQMTPTERAFLPRDVRERLSQYVNSGMLPPAPAIYAKTGVAMFVDISGFSALGERLKNSSEGSKQAAEEFSRQITCVLNDLTKICLASGGDVAKYAGDALLCTFHAVGGSGGGGGDEDECLVRAQNCAIDMLMSMRRYNDSSASATGALPMEIHGGISRGTIMHFHLGSPDDELRWYLVAGDAVSTAVSLVNQARPGQILLTPQLGLLSPKWVTTAGDASTASTTVERTTRDSLGAIAEDGVAVGLPMGIDGLSGKPGEVLLVQPSPKAAALAALDLPTSSRSSSTDHPPTPSNNNNNNNNNRSKTTTPTGGALKNRKFTFESGEQQQSKSSSLTFGSKTVLFIEDGTTTTIRKPVELFVVSADTTKVEVVIAGAATTATSTGATAPAHNVYELPLHASGTAYIPTSLREGLRTGFNTSEMRSKVSVVFVGLPNLTLTDNELASHSLPGSKLGALNQAFVQMTRVAHSFHGEIRDLLFDDKGCIFIAVFGAFASSELSELKACKCAMAISHEFPHSRVGVSSGTCFVGMCGSSKRHDFVVMGHEVNVAARCMVVAGEGQVLVSPEIERETRELIQYEKAPFALNKHHQDGAGASAGGAVYIVNSEIARRPSFLAQYRYGLRDKDLFVGRRTELRRMERTILRVVFGNVAAREYEDDDDNDDDEEAENAAVRATAAASTGSATTRSNKLHAASSSSFSAFAAAAAPSTTSGSFVGGGGEDGGGGANGGDDDAWFSSDEPGSAVLLIESAAGMGKSAFVSRVKKFGKGRLIIASSAAFSLEQENEFFVFRHLLEGFTGLRRDMSTYQLRRIVNDEFYDAGDDAQLMVDFDVLADVLPWMRGVMRGGQQQQPAPARPASYKLTPERLEKIGREVIKLLSGFRGGGGLTLNQVLGGDQGKGVLLCIEDVQWMDLASLRLLKYVLANLGEVQGVVVLLTSRMDKREGEASANSSSASSFQSTSDTARLTRQVLALAKPPSARALPTQVLTGLNASDTHKLVALLLKVDETQVARAVLDFVFDRTQGYPMYIISLLEWIHDHKLLTEEADAAAASSTSSPVMYDWVDANMDTSGFPNTLADTMLSRFDTLDVQTRNLLKIATALGNEFDAMRLTTLANIDLARSANKNVLTEDKVLDSLIKAEAQGVVSVRKSKGVRAGAHVWRFKHDTMMLAVQSLIPAERNEQLHQLLVPMRQVVENKRLLPLFAGFLGEVDSDDDDDEDVEVGRF